MSNSSPSLAAETEALREAYAALNRNDMPATVKAFDPQIEWTEPAEYPGGGTYHGHAEVKDHLSQSRAAWAEGTKGAWRMSTRPETANVPRDVSQSLR